MMAHNVADAGLEHQCPGGIGQKIHACRPMIGAPVGTCKQGAQLNAEMLDDYYNLTLWVEALKRPSFFMSKILWEHSSSGL